MTAGLSSAPAAVAQLKEWLKPENREGEKGRDVLNWLSC